MAQAQTVEAPLRIPLVSSIASRDAAIQQPMKDARLINCYAEYDPKDKHFFIEKRFGLSASIYTPTTGAGKGIYFWETSPNIGDLYHVVGNTLYKNNANLATLSVPATTFRFQPIRSTPAMLVLGDGNNAYYTDGTTVTNIHAADADFPATFVPGFAYLDGTLYVMDTAGGIHGSAIDDPTSWDPLNKIIARVETDLPVALFKHLVYVVAVKRWTMEAFYDAGNAVGSPLTSIPGSFTNYGCVSADTVQEIDGTHFWATSNRTLSPQVVRMDNLQITVVSTPPVERLLDNTVLAGFRSLAFKHAGHRFYAITSLLNTIGPTLVYDIDQQLWYQWTDATGTKYWPVGAMSYVSTHLGQNIDTGAIYIVDADYAYPNDVGVVPPVDIYTENFDGGIDRMKNLPVMRFDADQVQGSSLLVRVNDDDYQDGKWSNFRSVDLSIQRPTITDCGSFYRRAWHLRHQSNTPFRIKSAYLQLDKGTL